MAQFIVSARKYRPQRFSDVLGQEHISHTLKMAFSQDKLAHAFLFTGPRGVGKTTCARILARTLNCLAMTPDYEPCGECESCRSFEENASFSIFELDAASNNSVDHIRSLVDQVRIPPMSGKYKVFIIDEVHMLTTAAFNAFLKTLEEPPSYAVFILATTEKHKILPTILSRCQIFDFRRLQISDIVKQLNIIATEEGIQTESEALHLIATKADGAMRDALSIFDRIAGANNNLISYDAVTANLNILDYSYFFKVFDALTTEDLPTVMMLFDEVLRLGFDPEVFLDGLAGHLRQLLVCKDSETIALIENTDEVRARYKAQSELAGLNYLVTCIDLCNECDIHFKTARNKRLHLEIALIKLVFLRSAFESKPLDLDNLSEKKNDLNNTGKESLNAPQQKITKPAEEAEVVKIVHETAISEEPDIISQSTPAEPAMQKTMDPPELTPSVSSKATPPDVPVSKESASKGIHQTYSKPGPKIDRLSKLESQARDQIETEENQQSTFNDEAVKDIIYKYAQKASDTVRIILTTRAIRCLENDTIEITVASSYERDTLINEMPLLENLRHTLKNKRIRFECVTDATLIKDFEKLKPLNPEEKYDKMVEKNPLVKDLIQQLNMRIED